MVHFTVGMTPAGRFFDCPWKFKQRLWPKAGRDGHPDKAQLEAWEDHMILLMAKAVQRLVWRQLRGLWMRVVL